MIPNWLTKKVFAWSLYDFADTAFSALFITFFFPILIKVHLGGNEFQIGLSMGLSVLVAALLVPLIGAISDASGKRMPIIVIAALATALITVFVGYSGLFLALFLGSMANITHLISKNVYSAKMIDLVPRSFYGMVSGFGVGVGYFGTITSLAVGYLLFYYFGWENINGIRAMFWEAAAFYIIFSLPLFFLVPDKPRTTFAKQLKYEKGRIFDNNESFNNSSVAKVVLGKPTGSTLTFTKSLKKGFTTIRQTIISLPKFPVFSRFLMASFFYNNGMNTAIVFLYLYGRETIGLGIQQFFPIFALMALSAAFGSFLFGKLSDKKGPVILIRIALLIWIGVILLLIFAPSYSTFLIAGILGGAVLGAIWTLNRQMVALISPQEKIAELFGFQGLTENFSGVIGPVIFGYLVVASGYTAALISVIIFFIIGFVMMTKISKISQ